VKVVLIIAHHHSSPRQFWQPQSSRWLHRALQRWCLLPSPIISFIGLRPSPARLFLKGSYLLSSLRPNQDYAVANLVVSTALCLPFSTHQRAPSFCASFFLLSLYLENAFVCGPHSLNTPGMNTPGINYPPPSPGCHSVNATMPFNHPLRRKSPPSPLTMFILFVSFAVGAHLLLLFFFGCCWTVLRR
jgi:hypothetical protein